MRNKYEIRGDVTAIFIKRRSGETLETLIDTADLPILLEAGIAWYVSWDCHVRSFYVFGGIWTYQPKKKETRFRLHRFLFGLHQKRNKHIIIDHINHDTLDNRRSSNLRIVTHAQNCQNLIGPKVSNKSTGIRNVYFKERDNKYIVFLRIKGKRTCVGTFFALDEAIAAEKAARAKYMPYSYEATTKNYEEVNLPEIKYFNGKRISAKNKTGTPGVFQTESGKWKATITVSGKYVNLGLYLKTEDAIRARLDAENNFRYGLSMPFPCPDARL